MLGVVGFLPFVRQCVSGGVHGHEHVSDSSTCFDVDVFSIIQYIGTSQLISEFLSEGLDLCVDVYLMYPWEDRKLGVSYSAILLTSFLWFYCLLKEHWGFPSGSVVKNLLLMQEMQVYPWIRNIPWRRNWQPTPVFLPGKSHGQRSLAGYSSWGSKKVRDDLVTTQQQRSIRYLAEMFK